MVAARFLFDEAEVDKLFQGALDADVAGAQLSTSFRIYYRLRPLIPIAARQLLQRWRNQNVEVDDQWFVPAKFFEELEKVLAGGCPLPELIHPWPSGHQYALTLTHDVETREGMRLIDELARIEEELGFRSSWNIVPYKYAIDDGLLADLRARGFEIGIQGFNHDGRLFCSYATFRRRSHDINRAIARFGAVGFRAPMVHRNLDWLQLLDIDYDSSYFDIDPFQAMPGGVGGIWPFVAGRFVELPYTLPQDHTLLVGLGETTDTIWQQKLSVIKKWSGMALLLTHPDYLDSPQRREIYRSFLIHLREQRDYWHALPREVAQWWRDRDQSRIVEVDNKRSVEGPAAEVATIATCSSDGMRDACSASRSDQLLSSETVK